MLRAVRSAWVGLGRRAVLGATLVAAAAFSLLVTAVTFTSATDTASGAPPAGPAPAIPTRATLELADGVVAGLGNATTFLGIIAIVVGASAVASDYQHGTLRTLLVRQPARVTLLGGKVVAVLCVLVVAALTAAVVAAAAALGFAGGAGVDTGAWTVGEVALAALRTAAAMAGYGLLGCALGLALRSPVAAIGVGIAWVMAVEEILASAWDGARNALPGQVLSAVAEGSTGGGDLVVACLWGAAAAAGGAVLVRRRDVTS